MFESVDLFFIDGGSIDDPPPLVRDLFGAGRLVFLTGQVFMVMTFLLISLIIVFVQSSSSVLSHRVEI